MVLFLLLYFFYIKEDWLLLYRDFVPEGFSQLRWITYYPMEEHPSDQKEMLSLFFCLLMYWNCSIFATSSSSVNPAYGRRISVAIPYWTPKANGMLIALCSLLWEFLTKKCKHDIPPCAECQTWKRAASMLTIPSWHSFWYCKGTYKKPSYQMKSHFSRNDKRKTDGIWSTPPVFSLLYC